MEHSAGRMRDSEWMAPPGEEARSGTLQLLFENNERALHLIAEVIGADGEPHTPAREFSRQLRDPWRNIDAATLARVACFPTLLLDIGGWDAPAMSGESAGFFPDAGAVPLMRSTLTLAWHVCRTDRPIATLLLGLPPLSVEAFSRLRLQDLEHIALTRARCLRPRWSTEPSMWIGLLMTSRGVSLNALTEFKLHALQKMIGEVLARHADTRTLPSRCSRA